MGLEKYENRTDTDIQANHMYNLFSFTKDQENNYWKNPRMGFLEKKKATIFSFLPCVCFWRRSKRLSVVAVDVTNPFYSYLKIYTFLIK